MRRSIVATGSSVLVAFATATAAGAGSGSGGCLPGGGHCPIVVDVREESEWLAGHISCAHRIPVQDNTSLADEIITMATEAASGYAPTSNLAWEWQPIVTYCHSGARAGQAETTLKARGLRNVIDGWGYNIPEGNTAVLQRLCDCSHPCPPAWPATMRAISALPSYKGLTFVPEAPTPHLGSLHSRFSTGRPPAKFELPQECEVLVKVMASSVNPSDQNGDRCLPPPSCGMVSQAANLIWCSWGGLQVRTDGRSVRQARAASPRIGHGRGGGGDERRELHSARRR